MFTHEDHVRNDTVPQPDADQESLRSILMRSLHRSIGKLNSDYRELARIMSYEAAHNEDRRPSAAVVEAVSHLAEHASAFEVELTTLKIDHSARVRETKIGECH